MQCTECIKCNKIKDSYKREINNWIFSDKFGRIDTSCLTPDFAILCNSFSGFLYSGR